MREIRFCQYCGSPLVSRLHDGRQRSACSSCGAIAFLDPKVVAGVIVEIDGKIVMIRRNLEPGIGRWTFPAGYVDRGESVEDAAVREMDEESGLKVRIDDLVGVYSQTGDAYVLIVYTGSVVGGALAAGPEAQEAGLFDPSDLPPMAFERDTAILADWMRRKTSRSNP